MRVVIVTVMGAGLVAGCSSSPETAASTATAGESASALGVGTPTPSPPNVQSTESGASSIPSSTKTSGPAKATGSASPQPTIAKDASKSARPTPRLSVEPSRKPLPTITANTTEQAPFGNGVTVLLTGIKSVEHEAQGLGEISGPAVDLTLVIENSGQGEVDLSSVTVDLTYGSSGVPAGPLRSAGSPFAGVAGPGESAQGTYRFSVPVRELGTVKVLVNYSADEPTVVLEGSLT